MCEYVQKTVLEDLCIYVRCKFSCVRLSLDLSACTLAQLRGNIGNMNTNHFTDICYEWYNWLIGHLFVMISRGFTVSVKRLNFYF